MKGSACVPRAAVGVAPAAPLLQVFALSGERNGVDDIGGGTLPTAHQKRVSPHSKRIVPIATPSQTLAA
jgi:hypothetical protein